MLQVALIVGYDDVDSVLKDLVHSAHLFAAAFHVECVHLLRHSLSLLRGDGGEPLSFE